MVRNPFEQNCFIENKGQFPQNAVAGKENLPVLYSTLKGKVHVYFTANSVVYLYDSLVAKEDDDNKLEKENKVVRVPYVFSMNWGRS